MPTIVGVSEDSRPTWVSSAQEQVGQRQPFRELYIYIYIATDGCVEGRSVDRTTYYSIYHTVTRDSYRSFVWSVTLFVDDGPMGLLEKEEQDRM